MREENLSPKVKALYDAVVALIAEDMDVNEIKVSDITTKAGIGKGTAYEYFSNKEEIICNALIYHIDRICGHMLEGLGQVSDFTQMIHYILDCMDKELAECGCFIKFVHLMTDSGSISRTLQTTICEREREICLPQTLAHYVLQKGIENGCIKDAFPFSYMKLSMLTKIIGYAFYLTDERSWKEFDQQQMHQLIGDSLLKEFN